MSDVPRVGFEAELDEATRRAVLALRREVAELRRTVEDRVSEWTSFTPSWTNWDPNGGTETAYYRYVNGEMEVIVQSVLASGFTVGNLRLTLPDSAVIATPFRLGTFDLGDVTFRDVGTATHLGNVQYNSSTSVAIVAIDSNTQQVVVGTLSPFEWVAGDYMTFRFRVPVE